MVSFLEVCCNQEYPADELVACTYMALFADFGTHEHVFSPVSDIFTYTSRALGRHLPATKVLEQGTLELTLLKLRRMYRQYTKDLVTLSPSERSALGLDGADTGVSTASDATGNGAGAGDRGSQPIGSLSLEGSLRDPTRRAF